MPFVLPILLPCTVSSLTLQHSSSACHKVVLFWCIKEMEIIAASSSFVLQDVFESVKVFWRLQIFHNFKIPTMWAQLFKLSSTASIMWAPIDFFLFLVFSPLFAMPHRALLYLSHLDHSVTMKFRSSELKVSKLLRPLSFLASLRIRLKSTSTSSVPTVLPICFAMIVLSLAFNSLPPFRRFLVLFQRRCTTVAFVILLFPCELQYFISSCVVAQQSACILENEMVPQIPYLSNREKHQKLGDHRSRGNRHISHIRHHPHTRAKQFHNCTNSQILPWVPTKKDRHNSPDLSFDKQFQKLFLFFSFLLFTHFFFILLGSCCSDFFTSLFPTPVVPEVFLMSASLIALGNSLFFRFFLMPLNCPSQICFTAFDTRASKFFSFSPSYSCFLRTHPLSIFVSHIPNTFCTMLKFPPCLPMRLTSS